MSKVEKFEDLFCWQKARELVNQVYEITDSGKFSKDYDLRSQIRRASISIMSNIAEGFSRYHKKEFIRFLDIAQSSGSEVKSQLYIAADLEYIEKDKATDLFNLIKEVRKTTLGLLKYLDRNVNHVKEPDSIYSGEGVKSISIPDKHINTK
ncbi:MAG: hypothetical protein MAGBODY4_00640 [Candidatus Marinimicrobia bacterium]|nr:hypothetical protein [Candidatus Neomarinimicrobiota bacterium]